MLLVIDVGNTNITLGVFEKENLLATFRMTTKQARTSDEFGILMRLMIQERGLNKDEVQDVIISSVVPDVMYSLNSAIVKYFGTKPLIVGPGVKTGIRIATDNPKEIGADRIVDAVAGYTLYGGPVLVIDYGSGTTYDRVDDKSAYQAGITSPGDEICANALWEGAAKLPKIAIEKPKSILAKETITSMQAGLVYGYIGQTEYIIDKVREESGYENLKVVATGGLGKIIADETDKIDVYDNMLTLKGLRIIYEKNR